MIRLLKNTIFSLLMATFGYMTITSCSDDLLYDNTPIGEGETNLEATLTFNPMEVGLDTRSSGTAVNSFNNVWVVVYTTDGKFFKKFKANAESDYRYQPAGNSSYPTDSPTGHPEGDPDSDYDHASQTSTPKATFSFKDMPYGKYRMYAVANLDMLPDDVTQNEEALKSYKVKWDTNVVNDNSMFGYFTLDSDKRSLGFNAPDITINKPGMKLHCWMKRTVSKVTIAFDPSGLKESVTVYIRSVSIHDIPKECTLGENNTPKSENDLIKDGEIFYYGDGATNSSDHTGWLRLQKGTGVKGSDKHLETDDALYFFENMQGNYEGQKDFLKQQIKDETGTSINEPEKDDDGNVIINENGNLKTDYKDRVPYGTYIEVEGYYVSKNSEKMSKGPIKYRFMLGQNTTYNYDSQRNCHYKLTLKFHGWANQADWHIVYDEPTPSILISDPYYISYLYNQNMMYPIRLTGIDYIRQEKLHLHSQIIENNWVPSIEKTGALAPEIIGAYDDPDGFAWNIWAYQHIYNGDNYAGFLSVRKNTQTIVGIDHTYGVAGNQYLERNYEGREVDTPRYYADYSLEASTDSLMVSNGPKDGKYIIKEAEDNSVTLNIPLYTRPKELIPSSDFTGNNPFSAYIRKAVVRFSLRPANAPDPTSSKASGYNDAYDVNFKIRDIYGNEQEVKYVDVTIYQVPRIVNPKAIWRKNDSDAEFHVELMQLDAAGGNSYSTFKSDGPWRASIVTDPNNLIKLSSGNQEVTTASTKKYIEGPGDTPIDFWYQPRGTCGSDEARCGIILVEYHNYTCHHLIFVRQGYDKGMKLGQATWSCYNAYAAGSNATNQQQQITTTDVIVTNSPLSIGSMFKKCNYNYAILESNNSDHGWLQSITNTNLTTAYRNGTGTSTRPSTWDAMGAYPWQVSAPPGSTSSNYRKGPENELISQDIPWADTWIARNKGNIPLAVPTYEDYSSLRDNCQYGYGIVYADDATEVAKTLSEAQGFVDTDNSGKGSTRGMRACIVYNQSNGDQVIFPIGAEGQGRRARSNFIFNYTNALNGQRLENFPYPGVGALTYSGARGLLYTPVDNNGQPSPNNNCRPLTYNLYREPGAIYWFKQAYRKPWASTIGRDNRVASWDINYYTLVFNPYDSGSLGGNTSTENQSDALPIKFIYK